MIWSPLGYWRRMTKRERKLADAKALERGRERQARNDAKHEAEVARKRGSWERMKAAVAAKYQPTEQESGQIGGGAESKLQGNLSPLHRVYRYGDTGRRVDCWGRTTNAYWGMA